MQLWVEIIPVLEALRIKNVFDIKPKPPSVSNFYSILFIILLITLFYLLKGL